MRSSSQARGLSGSCVGVAAGFDEVGLHGERLEGRPTRRSDEASVRP